MDKKYNVPPVDKKTWLCLREFALRKTKEKDRLVTMGEIVQEAITEYIERHK